MHTSSPLLTIYAKCKIGLDSDVLRNLLPSVRFKKREKHPCSSVTFSKVAGEKSLSLPKVTFLQGFFSRF